jgi:hypothetical protein
MELTLSSGSFLDKTNLRCFTFHSNPLSLSSVTFTKQRIHIGMKMYATVWCKNEMIWNFAEMKNIKLQTQENWNGLISSCITCIINDLPLFCSESVKLS